MIMVLLTGFAFLGVAFLIIGSTVANKKFHSSQHTVLTILDTVPKPDSPISLQTSQYIIDAIPKTDSPVHVGFVGFSKPVNYTLESF